MNKPFAFDPKLDFAIERFIEAPTRLVWEALTKPEHLKEWYMPKPWGRVARAEMDVRPGGMVILNSDAFAAKNLERAGYTEDPLPALRRRFRVIEVPLTTLNREAVKDLRLGTR